MNKSSWQIEYQCPQCGAPVILEETHRILSCSFCRTRLYMEPGEYFQYCIPPSLKTKEEVFYIPYWRFRGLCYAFKNAQIDNRYVDINLRALDMDGMMESLGLRPQAMKLKFASPQISGRFLKPILSLSDIMNKIAEINVPGSFFHIFIGENASVIFTPVYLREDVLHDAVLNKPLTKLNPRVLEVMRQSAGTSDGLVRFVSTLCPDCGWDMEGEKDALVLICRNCNSAWRYTGTEMEKVPMAVVDHAGSNICYLPFWRMKVRIEGIRLESYADLIRTANLPKAVTPAMENVKLDFWSPAFKLNPVLFQRWARQMTIFQPGGSFVDSLFQKVLHPVNLPVSEAAEGVVLTIADITIDKRGLFPNIPSTRITMDEYQLVYHPFLMGNNEFVHATMRLSIDKNALAFGIRL